VVHANRNSRDWFTAWVIGLAVTAAAISILNSFWPEPAVPRFDEKYYYSLAEAIANGSYNDGYLVRPPLYPLFLAAIFRSFGLSLTPALVIQGLLRGLVVAGIALMGRRYISKRAGLVGAGILVVYPSFIQSYTRLMTEAVYIPLFILSFYLIARMVRTESKADAVKAGVACGAASLARSTSAFLTLLVAVWLVFTASGSGRFSKRKAVCAGLLVLTMAVTISPWTVRNLVVHGGLILLSNDSAFNLWLVASGKKHWEGAAEWETWGTQVERQREGYRRWFNYLRENPNLHIRRLLSGLPRLVLPEWGSRMPAAGPGTRGGTTDAALIYESVFRLLRPVTHLLLLVGGLVGVVLLERSRPRRNLLLLTVFYFLAAHSATLAMGRFMVPLNVLLAVYSGALIDRMASLRRPPAR
jgi:4-amino-4-deoxy-L-arabinose transferase-like glycosyltransferase